MLRNLQCWKLSFMFPSYHRLPIPSLRKKKAEVLKLLKKIIQISSPSSGHFALKFVKIYPIKSEIFVSFDADLPRIGTIRLNLE